MAEPASVFAGGLMAKLLPAGIGAAIMVLVDPPQSKRELFFRLVAIQRRMALVRPRLRRGTSAGFWR